MILRTIQYDFFQVQTVDQHVYLADFGLARVLSSTQMLGTQTLQAGTPGFQAPEQLKAEHVDQSCDVYAFGVVLLELFGEKPVWEGLNHFQIMCKVAVEGVLPEYSHLPHDMQRVREMYIVARPSRKNLLLLSLRPLYNYECCFHSICFQQAYYFIVESLVFGLFFLLHEQYSVLSANYHLMLLHPFFSSVTHLVLSW